MLTVVSVVSLGILEILVFFINGIQSSIVCESTMLSYKLMRVLDASGEFASEEKTVAGDSNPNPFSSKPYILVCWRCARVETELTLI